MKRGSAGGKATAVILRTKAIEKYYSNPVICKNCEKIIKVKDHEKASEIKRKKFCDQSCAASYNNKKHPKRKKIIKLRKLRNNLIDNKTKKEVFDSCNTWQAARNTIRKHAFRTYFKYNKEYKCEKCGYNLHINVCHLKAVSDFPDDTLIKEINDKNNLIGLCPNHHWELDNYER